MNRPELFKKTYDIMLAKWQEDVIEPRSACGCWIGSLIAGNAEQIPENERPEALRLKREGILVNAEWSRLFSTSYSRFTMEAYQYRSFDKAERYHDAKIQVDITGYTMEELANMEYAFESMFSQSEDINESIMSALDSLLKIHDVDDDEAELTINEFMCYYKY